jgi:chromosome transmission fidelity protein 1
MHDCDEKHPYGFPIPPYPVQRALMDAITDAIDTRSFGLFESPTGTGKTLSVICATMTWLLEHRLDIAAHDDTTVTEDANKNALALDPEETEPSWVAEHAKRKAAASLRATFERRSLQYSRRVANTRARVKVGVGRRGVKAQRLGGTGSFSTSGNQRGRMSATKADGKFLLPTEPFATSLSSGEHGSGDAELPFNLDQLEGDIGLTDAEDEGVDSGSRLRLIFATRTHTQLSQFVAELRKTTSFAIDCLAEQSEHILHVTGSDQLPLSVVMFGSRKIMCINDGVRNLPSASAVSERCRELTSGFASGGIAKSKKRGHDGNSSGCCYKDAAVEDLMRDMALVRPHDVEELATIGRDMHGCPYFASRAAISTGTVDVLGVPYSAILHDQTRESLGIKIDSRTVIVFDEAHNVVDAVNDLHTASLSCVALEATNASLQAYRQRYESRLSPQSLFNVNQILACVEGLLSLLVSSNSSPAARGERSENASVSTLAQARVVSLSTLIFEAGIENLNLFQLLTFIRNTRLCQKLLGFVDAGLSDYANICPAVTVTAPDPAENGEIAADVSNTSFRIEGHRQASKQGISSLETFLLSLNSGASNGRVAVYPDPGEGSGKGARGRMRYFVLNPGTLFTSAVSAARAVLLVGGTLSPREAMKNALFTGLPNCRKVVEFECDHVIPASNLTGMVCSAGPSPIELKFTRHTRNDPQVVHELGCLLLGVASSSPGGVIVFFASYAFMSGVIASWTTNGFENKLGSVKPIFYESRGEVGVFASYSSAIRSNRRKGAILMAVLGGRLSEGINFSDDLGRVVMVVGMPFANASDVETKEVLRNLPDARQRSEYLENACMTIVNQAIGRSIRHRFDYAAVLLCDSRYSRRATQDKLPRFVRQSLKGEMTFDDVRGTLNRFFSLHQAGR